MPASFAICSSCSFENGEDAAAPAEGAGFGAAAVGYARAGTAYGARVACSCRFVAGRSLEDCAKDKVGGMELVTLSEDVEEKSVTARMLIVSDTARMKPGYGCVLDPWEG